PMPGRIADPDDTRRRRGAWGACPAPARSEGAPRRAAGRALGRGACCCPPWPAGPGARRRRPPRAARARGARGRAAAARAPAASAAGEASVEGPLHIRFDGVTFAYDGGQRPALHDVSFGIRAGQRVALVGPSGAGKSTVAALLLRFIAPQRGGITVNGAPLA